MKHYTVAHCQGMPDWSSVESLEINNLQWSPIDVDIRAEARLCWDESAIYVYLRAFEQNIRAVHVGATDMVCEDSCLEFFLRPLLDDRRYFNFEFNPNCALYLGFGSGMHDLVRLLVAEPAALFAPNVTRGSDEWAIQYRIPVEFIARFFPGFSLIRGQKLRANCYKCGDLTQTQHYLSWNPMQCATPEFHRPDDFGMLTLG